MDFLESYVRRLEVDGSDHKESFKNSTKRQAYNYIMNSPTLSYVILNDEETARPSIVSDVETFHKRRFLFLPDSVVNVGNYIMHDNMTYLAINSNRDEIYPELTGELCNETFRLIKGRTRIIVDYDFRGAPIYDYVDDIADIPCVLTTKAYSALSNSPIPLPTGSMIAKIPYDSTVKVPTNYKFNYHDTVYKVTSISREYVIDEIGYIEIYLQRDTGGDSNDH